MKIVFFQTGDYAQAYRSLGSGAPETYRDQRASVDFVAGLAADHDVTTLARCDDAHDLCLAPRLRSIGVPPDLLDAKKTHAILSGLGPDILILRSPHVAALDYAKRHSVPTLPCFADLFRNRRGLRGWRDRRYHRMIRKLLEGPRVPCVANHSLNASRSVVTVLGYPAARTVPWDWSPVACTTAPKSGVADPASPTLFYAGTLSEAKGVGDMLEALSLLRKRGARARLTLAGSGPLGAWQDRAAGLGLTGEVTFLGLIPNSEVRDRMSAHDLVLVPSRHTYPEGLPNTIYEALASRSPLLLSDHPAFAGRIDAQGAVAFRAGDPSSLADAIQRATGDGPLYAALSRNADQTLSGLYVGMTWQGLVETFLNDPANATGWVENNSLSMVAGTSVS